jgi:HEAT repeat protein
VTAPTTVQRPDVEAVNRARRAGHNARLMWPGPIGDGLWSELCDWAEWGWRIGSHRALSLIEDIEARWLVHVQDRTYG